MITRCPRKVAYIKRAFGNGRAAAARQRNLPGTILRKKRPLLSRLNQAYISLALIPEDTDGSRTVSLARYGAYEVRLVEFPPSLASDAFPFWLKLYRRDLRTSLDSRCCQDLDHAEAVAEHLVSRAKQLHRADARPVPSS
jgi:hypothetical protein